MRKLLYFLPIIIIIACSDTQGPGSGTPGKVLIVPKIPDDSAVERGIDAVPDRDGIFLAWYKLKENNLRYYNIYRQRDGETFYRKIKVIDLAEDLIRLSGLKPGEDIEIKFTGLRPGEKLYEEMFLDTERDKSTRHNKIYIAQPNGFDPKKLRKDIKELERLSTLMDGRKIVRKMRELVPSYNPSNSKT